MREFVTSIEDAFETEPDEGNALNLDGRELHYFKPTDGQVAVYLASTGRHSSTDDKVAAVVNFFLGMFEEGDAAYLSDRLLDRTDPFGTPKIAEIVNVMIEDWSGRPTKPPTGSSGSRRTGGRKSTEPTLTST
jgi:hypothetical protein